MIAFASACTVETQCPSSMTQPTSEQCGSPRIEPLYPVERIVLSRTITAPTCLRGQVDRVETCRAMFMKYVCQSTRCSLIGAHYARAVNRGRTDHRDRLRRMSKSPRDFPQTRPHHRDGGRDL